jgi:hypothetical protein
MTKDERQELRQIQETLITTLARVTELLGSSKPASKPVRITMDPSESKERFIAP